MSSSLRLISGNSRGRLSVFLGFVCSCVSVWCPDFGFGDVFAGTIVSVGSAGVVNFRRHVATHIVGEALYFFISVFS